MPSTFFFRQRGWKKARGQKGGRRFHSAGTLSRASRCSLLLFFLSMVQPPLAGRGMEIKRRAHTLYNNVALVNVLASAMRACTRGCAAGEREGDERKALEWRGIVSVQRGSRQLGLRLRRRRRRRRPSALARRVLKNSRRAVFAGQRSAYIVAAAARGRQI